MSQPTDVSPQRTLWRVLYCLVVLLFLLTIPKFYDPATGLTSLIRFGVNRHLLELDVVRATPHLHDPGSGYDGQFYSQLAVAPLLNDRQLHRATDGLPYRARRILLPWSAYLLGVGHTAWVLQAYAAQNILAWVMFAWVLTHWFPANNGRHFGAWCACLLAIGTIGSVVGALLAVPSVLLLALALRSLERAQHRTAALTLGVAVLTRETNVLMATALVGPGDLRSYHRDTARLVAQGLLMCLPAVVWYAYMQSKGLPLLYLGQGNFAIPGSGFLGAWTQLADGIATAGWDPAAVYKALFLLGLLVQAAYLLGRPRPGSAWWRVGMSYLVLMLLLGPAVWAGSPGAATRVLLPMTIAFNVLVQAERRVFWPLLVVANLAVVGGLATLGAPNPLPEARIHRPGPVSVFAAADTTLKRATPTRNYGSDPTLRVRGRGRLRGLVRFDQQAIVEKTLYRPIESAWLRLFIANNDQTWPADGGLVGAYRMLEDWQEAEASWDCAAGPLAASDECQGHAWMQANSAPAFADSPSAVIPHGSLTAGWVEFEVTEDVIAFMSGGAPNFGWLLKNLDEQTSGMVAYSSHEGARKPDLHIKLR